MIVSNEKKAQDIAKKVAKSIDGTSLALCLNGDLGSGKTTFTRHLIRYLQKNKFNNEIPSPTFTLLQIYDYQLGQIYHYDFYRLDKIEELFELNFSESLRNNICIIEWANKFKKALPANRIEINFEIISDNSRNLEFNFLGKFKKDIFKWL
jgi:tRNA threonylcarbamoyl adenosine modification protein YjeE